MEVQSFAIFVIEKMVLVSNSLTLLLSNSLHNF